MSNIERMTVVFPEPMAATIRAAVAEGGYASTSEVVREAVRQWSGRRRLRQEEIDALRRAWDDGKTSGVHGPIDMQSVIDEARAERRASDDAGGD